jgi:hypothetical protein
MRVQFAAETKCARYLGASDEGNLSAGISWLTFFVAVASAMTRPKRDRTDERGVNRAFRARFFRIRAACVAQSNRRGAVPVGNLRPEILVMQSAQNWHRQRATYSLDGTRDRRVLVQR